VSWMVLLVGSWEVEGRRRDDAPPAAVPPQILARNLGLSHIKNIPLKATSEKISAEIITEFRVF
jgi:hypothetical protein